jgi:antitoxin component of MazEF toxin-antitoxin module
MQVRRIHSQHSSSVVTIPRTTLQILGAKRGDYVGFEQIGQTDLVQIFKIKIGESKRANDKSNSDTQNQGRRT